MLAVGRIHLHQVGLGKGAMYVWHLVVVLQPRHAPSCSRFGRLRPTLIVGIPVDMRWKLGCRWADSSLDRLETVRATAQRAPGSTQLQVSHSGLVAVSCCYEAHVALLSGGTSGVRLNRVEALDRGASAKALQVAVA